MGRTSFCLSGKNPQRGGKVVDYLLLERMNTLHALPENRAPLFPKIVQRDKWEAIAEKDKEEVLCFAREWREKPYPMLRLSDYAAFVRTGSRLQCETPYFARRRKLIASVLAVGVTGKTDDLSDIEDGLWCICEETTWAISAHANLNQAHPFPIAEEPVLDLFAAQTAMVLAFTLALTEGLLQPELWEMVVHHIERRVLMPFLHRDTDWWMGFTRKDLCNWTPWIVSNVLFTVRLLLPDPVPFYRRACVMLDAYLRCVPEDGGCDEGVAYWNMATGSLLDCLELLEEAGLSCWEEEKLRQMLRFPLKMKLGGGYFVNFADCDARPVLYGERLQRAGEKMQDEALRQMGIQLRGRVLDSISDVPHFSRLLQRLFHTADAESTVAPLPEEELLPDLQVRIVRKDGFTFCIKGGHNGESHNHNDVGTFILFVDEHPLMVDAGNMQYTAKTFSGERYTLWNCRAKYHSIPMIGDWEQQEGIQHVARAFISTEDGASLDMALAYPEEAGVLKARRTAILSDGLTLTDEITLLNAQAVTYTFLCREMPEVMAGEIYFEHAQMTFDDALQVAVEEISVTDGRMQGSWPGKLWRIALTDKEATVHHQKFHVTKMDKRS